MHRLLIIAAMCLLLSSGSAFSQIRTRRSAPSRPRSSSSSSSESAATAIHNEGAAKVAIQIKNLTAFLYLLGGVAKSMQELDAAAKSGEASPTAQQQNEQNKARVKASFEDFRVGLDALETYFNSTPGLKSYYLKLAGSASGAATAENLAAAGQYDRAGRSLLDAVNRLTDTLAIMR
jgi:hypothetical protein